MACTTRNIPPTRCGVTENAATAQRRVRGRPTTPRKTTGASPVGGGGPGRRPFLCASDQASPRGTGACHDQPVANAPKRSSGLAAGTLLAVVALSADLFSHTTVPVHIWLLARDASHHLPAGESGSILFIDASRLGTQTPRGTRELPPCGHGPHQQPVPRLAEVSQRHPRPEATHRGAEHPRPAGRVGRAGRIDSRRDSPPLQELRPERAGSTRRARSHSDAAPAPCGRCRRGGTHGPEPAARRPLRQSDPRRPLRRSRRRPRRDAQGPDGKRLQHGEHPAHQRAPRGKTGALPPSLR
ncbi:N-6 DNA methylase [Streptomyces sp. NPDC002540]